MKSSSSSDLLKFMLIPTKFRLSRIKLCVHVVLVGESPGKEKAETNLGFALQDGLEPTTP